MPINYEAEGLDGMNMLTQGNTPLLFVERTRTFLNDDINSIEDYAVYVKLDDLTR